MKFRDHQYTHFFSSLKHPDLTVAVGLYADNSTEHDFVVTDISGNKTGAYQVQFRDSGTGRHWSEAYIDDLNIVGIAERPFILPIPRRILKGKTLYFKIKDTSVAGNTIQILLNGYKIYKENVPEVPKRIKRYYAYIYESTKVPTTPLKQDIKISTGHDFVVTHITGVSTEGYTLNIRDSGSNEFWFENAVNDVNIVGTAQYPYALKRTRFLKAGANLYFECSLPAITNTIQIVLHGYEIPK